MKKFKQFMSKATNPKTPGDWIRLCLTSHAPGEIVQHDKLEGRQKFQQIQKYIHQNHEQFRVQVNHADFTVATVCHTEMVINIEVLSDGFIRLFWVWDDDGR